MTRQTMRFPKPRGALIGIVGGLALALAGISMVTSGASAREAPACQSRDSLAKLLEERFTERPVAAGLEAGGVSPDRHDVRPGDRPRRNRGVRRPAVARQARPRRPPRVSSAHHSLIFAARQVQLLSLSAWPG